jgi:hypothetical protein
MFLHTYHDFLKAILIIYRGKYKYLSLTIFSTLVSYLRLSPEPTLNGRGSLLALVINIRLDWKWLTSNKRTNPVKTDTQRSWSWYSIDVLTRQELNICFRMIFNSVSKIQNSALNLKKKCFVEFCQKGLL